MFHLFIATNYPLFLSPSPQAFAPNQVKPYICTTEACPHLFVKTNPARGFKLGEKIIKEQREIATDKKFKKAATAFSLCTTTKAPESSTLDNTRSNVSAS